MAREPLDPAPTPYRELPIPPTERSRSAMGALAFVAPALVTAFAFAFGFGGSRRMLITGSGHPDLALVCATARQPATHRRATRTPRLREPISNEPRTTLRRAASRGDGCTAARPVRPGRRDDRGDSACEHGIRSNTTTVRTRPRHRRGATDRRDQGGRVEPPQTHRRADLRGSGSHWPESGCACDHRTSAGALGTPSTRGGTQVEGAEHHPQPRCEYRSLLALGTLATLTSATSGSMAGRCPATRSTLRLLVAADRARARFVATDPGRPGRHRDRYRKDWAAAVRGVHRRHRATPGRSADPTVLPSSSMQTRSASTRPRARWRARPRVSPRRRCSERLPPA